MNIEPSQDQTTNTTGIRLRKARESMGLSQQTVAERLCLKVSTVQDIENDLINPNLALTFLRGYVRSYARLVHVSEKELMILINKKTQTNSTKIAKIQSLSLGNTCKKNYGHLIWFITYLILFSILSISGTWLWKNYQAQQHNLVHMNDDSSAIIERKNDTTSADNIKDRLKNLNHSSDKETGMISAVFSSLSKKIPCLLVLINHMT